MSSNGGITDTDRLNALKKFLVVTDVDFFEKDALLRINTGGYDSGGIYFQGTNLTIEEALDFLVMEERKINV